MWQLNGNDTTGGYDNILCSSDYRKWKPQKKQPKKFHLHNAESVQCTDEEGKNNQHGDKIIYFMGIEFTVICLNG